MGICLSNTIKTECDFSTGTGVDSSKISSGYGNKFSSSSSKRSSASIPPTPRSEGEILQSSNMKSFAYNDLKAATKNFRPDGVLGEGGFGTVYKGWINEHSLSASRAGSGLAIAIKRLKQEGYQGHKEWLAEINYLGQLSHPNLVKLVGYCIEDDHRLLVYEFMRNGSLENHLFRRGSYFEPLSWTLRMKIALGAARGLACLHNAETAVIYRDFKASNILLDSNYNAKLSDFGLARDGPTGDNSHVSTRVLGTYAYAAPEYVSTGHLTIKSDVYSFGVVLLEILSGKKAVDVNRPPGEHYLVQWAKPYMTKRCRLSHFIDARLDGKYPMPEAMKATDLSLQCICMDPRARPNMDEIVTALDQLQDSNGIHPSKDDQSDYQMNRAKKPEMGLRPCRSSAGEMRSATTYPRPSASSLFA